MELSGREDALVGRNVVEIDVCSAILDLTYFKIPEHEYWILFVLKIHIFENKDIFLRVGKHLFYFFFHKTT